MDAIGIDIGGTSVKAAGVSDGRVSWTNKSGSFIRPDTQTVIHAIQEAIAERWRGTEAVGVCCPGMLDRAMRTITFSVNVPGIVGTRLDEIVERALGAPARSLAILSDANAVGYDMYRGRGLSGRLLCLTLGTGVGGSVIDEGGRFLHVSGESPGHFGQLDVSLDATAPIGPDGGRGSLEAYLGAGALAKGKALDRLSIDDLPIRALVRAIRIAHAIYRPDHVALTGGVGIRLAPLVEQIKAAVAKDLSKIARKDWTLFCGDSDFHGACGVARFAAAAA